jgi:DNA-binding NarL/FixJ family response regulator
MSRDAGARKRAHRLARTIAVVAGHTLLRTAMVRLLNYDLAGWDFIDMASIAELMDARGRDICLIVLSVMGRDLRSVSLWDDLARISREFPKAAIALLSDTDDLGAECRALEMGVRGYFTSSLTIDVALAGIRLVLAGGVYCPHPLANLKRSTPNGSADANGSVDGVSGQATPKGHRLAQVNGSVIHDGMACFTRRETDVLAELQLGHSNKAIAGKLNMSGNTVKMHLQHIMRKLHVQNRTEAVVLVQKMLGWRNLPSPELPDAGEPVTLG